jgi:hypothetical protein
MKDEIRIFRSRRIGVRRSDCTSEAFQHGIVCSRLSAVGTDAVFYGDDAFFVFAERQINCAGIVADVAVDYGQIFFYDGAGFPEFAELAGGGGVFCDDGDAAGFAIESVDDVGGGVGTEIQADTRDEAGVLIAFCGMADEVGGFV